ncbi:MAG: C10 family peptidase [Bacteroidaceae bacterium]|nr:C10 family peptidase [Bacteroidaceae bacterium]
MKHLFTLVSLFLVGLVVQAQTVTLETAQERASSFLKTHRTHANAVQAKTPNLTLAHRATDATGSEVYYYVFNNEAGGFVIVGGDDAAEEILGYSSEGSFDDKTLPPNFRWWLSVYSNQIASAIHAVKDGSLDLRAAKASRAKRKAPRSDISNMLISSGEEISWGQSTPFNCLIPFGQDPDPVVTGCTATAYAQLMYFYKYPSAGVGSKSYLHNVYDDNTKTTYKSATFSADFSTPLNWPAMKPKYASSWENNGSENAVASLMYKVAVASDMNFGRHSTGGSGANAKKAGAALVKYFNYDKSIKTDAREYFTDDQWESLIYNELRAGRPLIYSGFDTPTAGHTFICTGYQASSNKFYINWGWTGKYNGYFVLTPTMSDKALAPNGTGIGGSAEDASYILFQEIVYQIKPDAGGKAIIRGRANDITMNKTNAQAGEDVNLISGIINGGMFNVDMTIGVRLQNTADPSDVINVTSQTWTNVGSGAGNSYSFTVPTTCQAGKSYYVNPIFKDENGTWQDAEVPASVVRPTLAIDNTHYSFDYSAYTISVTSATYGDPIKTSPASLHNLSGIDVSKVPVALMFINTMDASDKVVVETGTLTMSAGSYYNESYSFSTKTPLDLAPGQSYKVVPVFKDADDVWKIFVLDGAQVDQILTVTAPDNIIVSEPMKSTNGGYVVTKDDLNVKFKLENRTGASKTIDLRVFIFPKGGGYSVGSFRISALTMADGEELSFSLTGTDFGSATLTEGEDYYYRVRDGGSVNLINLYPNQEIYVRPALPINYTLTGAGWGTICLPYEAAVPAGLKAYEVTNVISDVLQTAEVAKLEMNKPYLLKGTPDTYNFNGPTTPEGTWNNGCLVGNTQTAVTYAPADSYVLQNLASDGVAFYRVSADNTQKVKQYSAYLNVPAVVTSIFLPESDEVTAVESIPTVQAPSGVYYNIMGQQVRPGTKGIVISNGKKYLNK